MLHVLDLPAFQILLLLSCSFRNVLIYCIAFLLLTRDAASLSSLESAIRVSHP